MTRMIRTVAVLSAAGAIVVTPAAHTATTPPLPTRAAAPSVATQVGAPAVARASGGSLRGRARPSGACPVTPADSDRRPDVVQAYQVHVVYAFAAGAPDRSATLTSAIAEDVRQIGDWWARQDPTRRPRFDLYRQPGCIPALDITRVAFPDLGVEYIGYWDIVHALNDRRLLLNSSEKKYLVYFDDLFYD